MESLTDELLHCYEELGLIYETGELLASIARGEVSQWKAMSGTFLQLTIETLKADMGWIYFDSENKKDVHVEAVSSIQKRNAKKISLHFLSRVKEGTLMVNHPLDKNGNERADKTSLLIFSPFKSAGRFIGAIVIGKEGPAPFNSGDVKLLSHVSGYFSNIFENARMFQEIKEAYLLSEKANKRLNELNKMKKDFIAIASHELNTPLSIISLCLEMIKIRGKESLPEKLYDVLETMDEGRSKLAEIINNICSYSWLDEGKLSPEKESFYLIDITKEILAGLESIFRKRNINAGLRVSKDFKLFGDIEMIKNLISEIILNAVKNTPDGGKIDIKGERKKNETIVYISDNGNGIPQAEREHLFDPFHKAGDFMTHSSGTYEYKTGGIGIGLALAKRIVESHGGRIWLENASHICNFSKGSSFAVSLPLQ